MTDSEKTGEDPREQAIRVREFLEKNGFRDELRPGQPTMGKSHFLSTEKNKVSFYIKQNQTELKFMWIANDRTDDWLREKHDAVKRRHPDLVLEDIKPDQDQKRLYIQVDRHNPQGIIEVINKTKSIMEWTG